VIQFDLFEQGGEWVLPHKRSALPLAAVEVEPAADGWAYGARFHILRDDYHGAGFSARAGFHAEPTRAEAIASALAWIERHLIRYPPEHARFTRWRKEIA
jgi:hypothetical protein